MTISMQIFELFNDKHCCGIIIALNTLTTVHKQEVNIIKVLTKTYLISVYFSKKNIETSIKIQHIKRGKLSVKVLLICNGCLKLNERGKLKIKL